MKGIILTAGKGSRLSELNLQHKSLANVKNKYVIYYSLDFLVGEDKSHPLVSEIVIVVGHNSKYIIETIGNSYKNVPVTYVYQKELKGIAHAILSAKDVLTDDFIMCLADEILLNSDLKGMIEEFKHTDAICVCGIIKDGSDLSGKPIAYDIKEDNVIVKVIEKPLFYNNDIRGVGECIFKKECLEYLLNLKPNILRNELEMGNWIQMAVDDKGSARVFQLADAYVNINCAEDIEKANKMLDEK